MKTISNCGLSDYTCRTLAIEVTGSSNQALIRKGSYIIKVPFSSLSRTMQSIHKMGGKVVKVTMLCTTSSSPPLPIVQEAESLVSKPLVEKSPTYDINQQLDSQVYKDEFISEW